MCLFEQIPPKYKYTGNRQVPRYLTLFGLPTSNTEYCQIPPNAIWELALKRDMGELKRDLGELKRDMCELKRDLGWKVEIVELKMWQSMVGV